MTVLRFPHEPTRKPRAGVVPRRGGTPQFLQGGKEFAPLPAAVDAAHPNAGGEARLPSF